MNPRPGHRSHCDHGKGLGGGDHKLVEFHIEKWHN